MNMSDEKLDMIFSALSNSTRRAILEELSKGVATVNELAQPIDSMSLPAISKHIKVLEKAGLIEQSKKAQYRPCSINEDTIMELSSWMEYNIKIWTSRFNQLDQYINQLKEKEEQNGQ